MKTQSNRYVIIISLILFSLNVFGTRPIWHCILGGSYVFETHLNSNMHGFELNFNRHYSSCIQSNYLNSFGANVLYGNNYKEVGVSYTGRLFKNISGRGHGGWNIIYKINPNVIKGLEKDVYLIKPGIGTTIYNGARSNFVTLQAFILYNYDIYLQNEQKFEQMKNHSIQLGLFIGLNAFEMRPIKFKRNKTNNKDE